MVKEVSDKIQEPNQENVTARDFIVDINRLRFDVDLNQVRNPSTFSIGNSDLIIDPIYGVTKEGIIPERDFNDEEVPYEEAIILRSDGTYLLGKEFKKLIRK